MVILIIALITINFFIINGLGRPAIEWRGRCTPLAKKNVVKCCVSPGFNHATFDNGFLAS